MEQEGGFRSMMLLRGDVRVELLHWTDVPVTGSGRRRPMTELGLTHLSFRVDDVGELSAAIRAAGGEVHDKTLTVLHGPGDATPPVKLLYVTDPDGTRIELMENVPDLSSTTPTDGVSWRARG
jgi:glyoxylase I family protein